MTNTPTKTMNGKSIMPSLTVDDLDQSMRFSPASASRSKSAGNTTASSSA